MGIIAEKHQKTEGMRRQSIHRRRPHRAHKLLLAAIVNGRSRCELPSPLKENDRLPLGRPRVGQTRYELISKIREILVASYTARPRVGKISLVLRDLIRSDHRSVIYRDASDARKVAESRSRARDAAFGRGE